MNKSKCKICNREFRHNEPVFGGKDGYYSCIDHIQLKACISCTGGIVCWRCGEVCKSQPEFLEINGVGMNIEGYTDQQVNQVKEFADILLTSTIEEERKKIYEEINKLDANASLKQKQLQIQTNCLRIGRRNLKP